MKTPFLFKEIAEKFTDIWDGIARLQLEFLEWFLIIFIAIELDNRHIIIDTKFDENFLPEPVLWWRQDKP